MRFDEPAKATPLEGISGFGDSGGPAFISRDGKYFVAGISSNNSGVPGTCVYGSEDRYARVSAAATWIDEMMRSEPPSPFDWGEVQPVQASPFDSGTPLNPAIQAFLAAYNSLQAGQVERLMEYWPSSKGLDARIKTLSSLREQYGTMAPRSFSVRADQEVDVLFFCSKIQGLRRLRFRPGAHSAQIGNIAIREVEGV
jgi:hypothetical protein